MQYDQEKVQLMGTTIRLSIQHSDGQTILKEAIDKLRDYEKRFSANDPKSDLSQINQAAGVRPVQVDPDMFDLIRIGKKSSLDPIGGLNIAIGPLVQAWRIGFKDARKPSPEEIDELLQLINPEDIILNEEDQTVFLAKAGMKLDLGALAKGFFADQIIADFKAAGAGAGMINLGGNLLVTGPAPVEREDDRWHVGIQDPDGQRGEHALILKAKDQSVVTSGGYERQMVLGQQTYHHILDSKTGYPIISQMKSISIVSDLSLDGEIWTSQLFGKDPDTASEIVENTDGIEAIIISNDDQIYVTSGLVSHVIV